MTVEEAIATRTRRDEGVLRRVSKESIALNEDREERFGDEFLKIGRSYCDRRQSRELIRSVCCISH